MSLPAPRSLASLLVLSLADFRRDSGMRILAFIHHYHTPDCATAARPYSLIRHLAKTHEVTLVTTDAWRSKRLTHHLEWVPPSVRLIEIPVAYNNTMGPLRRMWAFSAYAIRALAEGLRAPRPDVIFASSTPLTVPAVGATVARWHDVPWVFEVRDLWPDFPIQMGAVPPVLHGVLRRAETTLYRSADQVIGLSPDMSAHVQSRAPFTTVSTVLYGTDMEMLNAASDDQVRRLRSRFVSEGEHLILYAGAFGRANAIPSLLTMTEVMRHRRDVRFVFTGSGYHADEVRHAARQHPAVTHLPSQPLPITLALFRAADLSICSFLDRPVLGANAPGKLFDSLAAGTPVITTNPGWTARMIRTHECGWTVPPEDPAALAQALEHALDDPDSLQKARQAATTLSRTYFCRKKAVAEIERCIQAAVR